MNELSLASPTWSMIGMSNIELVDNLKSSHIIKSPLVYQVMKKIDR